MAQFVHENIGWLDSEATQASDAARRIVVLK